MSLTSKTTATITFRISKKYEDYLRKKSKQERVSINIVANKIFGEYIEWQRYVERFGIVSMSKDAFKYVLDSLDDK